MDAKRLEEIRDRLAKITPGPWKQSTWRAHDYIHLSGLGEIVAEVRDTTEGNRRCHNAAFIANAPEDVQFLLEALDEAHDLIRILSTDSEAYQQGLSDGRLSAADDAADVARRSMWES